MAPKRRRAPTDPLKAVNRKSDEDFLKQHIQPSENWTTWTHPRSQSSYDLSFKRANALTPEEAGACFDLIRRTSSADYKASSIGWDPEKKKAEMKSPELRYILVKDREGVLQGFTSLMPTWEEGEPVVYCYEIHLEDEMMGTGLAKILMGFLQSVARNTPPIEKVMLTCFTCNAKALAFYKKLGFEKDAISPGERKLRYGKVFVPDYVIMSVRERPDA